MSVVGDSLSSSIKWPIPGLPWSPISYPAVSGCTLANSWGVGREYGGTSPSGDGWDEQQGHCKQKTPRHMACGQRGLRWGCSSRDRVMKDPGSPWVELHPREDTGVTGGRLAGHKVRLLVRRRTSRGVAVGLPGSPVVKTPLFHCTRLIDPWLEN